MRKASMLMTALVLAAMLLAACGGQGTSTSVPGKNAPPATSAGRSTSTASPSDLTTTPNVPVTGDDSPYRLTNLMDYAVYNQNGDQIGKVSDVVLDFDNASIPYVVVGAGGFLGLGEKQIAVPWKMLKVQAHDNANALLFTGKEDAYKNFPEADLSKLLPGTGQPAANWDNTIKNYWQNGGTGNSNELATNTPSSADMTAQPIATATAGAASGNSQGNGVQELQGVILASDLLKSTIEVNNNGTATNNGQSQGNGSNTPAATSASSTASPAATATSVDLGTGNTLGTEDLKVNDAILDPPAGKLQYVVVTGAFTGGQRTVAVPVKYLQWDATNQKFILGVNTLALVNAPAIEDDKYPDFTSKDWSASWDKYWNNLKSDMLNKTP